MKFRSAEGSMRETGQPSSAAQRGERAESHHSVDNDREETNLEQESTKLHVQMAESEATESLSQIHSTLTKYNRFIYEQYAEKIAQQNNRPQTEWSRTRYRNAVGENIINNIASELGVDRATAKLLVKRTGYDALQYYQNEPKKPADPRANNPVWWTKILQNEHAARGIATKTNTDLNAVKARMKAENGPLSSEFLSEPNQPLSPNEQSKRLARDNVVSRRFTDIENRLTDHGEIPGYSEASLVDRETELYNMAREYNADLAAEVTSAGYTHEQIDAAAARYVKRLARDLELDTTESDLNLVKEYIETTDLKGLKRCNRGQSTSPTGTVPMRDFPAIDPQTVIKARINENAASRVAKEKNVDVSDVKDYMVHSGNRELSYFLSHQLLSETDIQNGAELIDIIGRNIYLGPNRVRPDRARVQQMLMSANENIINNYTLNRGISEAARHRQLTQEMVNQQLPQALRLSRIMSLHESDTGRRLSLSGLRRAIQNDNTGTGVFGW